MQLTSTAQETFRVLNEVKSKGYIRTEGHAIASNYKQISHALADFLKATPVQPKEALECMDLLVQIGQNTSAFFSLFQNTVLDLYDWANAGDFLTSRFAETKLLQFFSQTAPASVIQKNRLLNNILKMPNLSIRRKEVSKAVLNLADHYSCNQQYNEDPDLSVLKPLSEILHQLSISPKKNRNDIAFADSCLQGCSAVIHKYCPDLYEEAWVEKFSLPTPKKIPVPVIKDPVDIYSHQKYLRRGFNFSKDWDRN